MKKVIITGQMRSGTTFVANLINSQDNCILYADFLNSIFDSCNSLKIKDFTKSLSSKEINIIVSNVIAELRLFGFDFYIDREKVQSVISLFDLLLEKLIKLEKLSSPNLVGTKNTRRENYIQELLSNDFKVIYVYRDIRDVLISAKNRFPHFDLINFADNWSKAIDQAFMFKGEVNFLPLKYEDLILKDKKTIKELSVFLGIELNLDLDSLKLRNHLSFYNDNSSFGDVTKIFDEKAVYRWKNSINSDEVQYTQIFLHKKILDLNYELPSLNINKSDKKRLSRQKLKFENTRRLKSFLFKIKYFFK